MNNITKTLVFLVLCFGLVQKYRWSKLRETSKDFKNFHATYKLAYGNKIDEFPEQSVLYNYIDENDKVLELGPNIGRSSIVINHRLKNKSEHVVVESDANIVKKLAYNRDINGLGFIIHEGAISDVPLYQSAWKTSEKYSKGATKISTISMSNFLTKYCNVNFNTIVADCEGCLVPLLKNNESFLNQINKVILEHDFRSKKDLNTFIYLMQKHGFTCVYKYPKDFLMRMFWPDGIKDDPVFVSVWSKSF